MKDVSFTGKDGSIVLRHKLEPNDVFIASFDEPRKVTTQDNPNLKWDKHTLAVTTPDGLKTKLELTAGQYKRLMGFLPLKNKKFKVVLFPMKGSYYPGIELHEDSMPAQNNNNDAELIKTVVGYLSDSDFSKEDILDALKDKLGNESEARRILLLAEQQKNAQ